MEYLFITLLLLGVYHFILEGMVAPTVRMQLRYKLFKCRDNLRMMSINDSYNIRECTYKHMQGLINAAIERMPSMDLKTLRETKEELENNPTLKKQLEKKVDNFDKEIEDSNCKELKELRIEVYRLFSMAFIINCSGWFIYLVPLIIGYSLFNKITSLVQAFLYFPMWAVEKTSSPGSAYSNECAYRDF